MRQDEEILKDSSAALFTYNASEWGLPYCQNYGELFIEKSRPTTLYM